MNNLMPNITNVSFRLPDRNFSLPKGKYLVIDPCYVLGHDDCLWKKIVEFTFPQDDPVLSTNGHSEIVINIDGHDVYMFSTAYGDGIYNVYNSRKKVIGQCPVDSGSLSLIPEEIVKMFKCDDGCLGTWVQVSNHHVVRYVSGNVEFGGNVIETDPEENTFL